MTERKAVVKNADMSDDMQQEAVDVATQVDNCMAFCGVLCLPSCACRPWKNSTLKRTLLHTSRKSLTRNIIPHGIALWGGTLALMSRMRQSTLSTFTWARLLCFSSSLDSHIAHSVHFTGTTHHSNIYCMVQHMCIQ